jgi:hypothetical protein
MANQYNNKITLKTGEVIIDLTQDDIKPEHVQKDIYFHDKTGERKQGTNTKTVDASGATAEASEVLLDRTFGKGSEMQKGTMPDNSGKDVVITNKDGTSIPVGYSDGSGKAKLSDSDIAKLIPGNIKEGVTILGVEGDFGTDDFSATSKEITPTFEEQTFNPADDGVSFYSSVKVNAIPVTRQDNEFGGVTVTIG